MVRYSATIAVLPRVPAAPWKPGVLQLIVVPGVAWVLAVIAVIMTGIASVKKNHFLAPQTMSFIAGGGDLGISCPSSGCKPYFPIPPPLEGKTLHYSYWSILSLTQTIWPRAFSYVSSQPAFCGTLAHHSVVFTLFTCFGFCYADVKEGSCFVVCAICPCFVLCFFNCCVQIVKSYVAVSCCTFFFFFYITGLTLVIKLCLAIVMTFNY